MTPHMTRRNAIVALGTAGLGGLLVACGGNDDDADARSTTTTTSGDGTGDATTTTTGSTGTGSGDLASMFEEAGSCSLTPEETEGPYYIDVDSIRSDIRDGRPGVDLRVGIRVLDEDCEPVPDAVVEIWHCDGLGTYSGFEAQSQEANGEGSGNTSNGTGTDETRYLRGGQITDAAGIAQILTIYPGWYQGRTVHIHSKVHVSNAEVLTTQLYFDDEVSDALFADNEPYRQHTGRETYNDDDMLFLEENLLSLSEDGGGYVGLITYSVDRG